MTYYPTHSQKPKFRPGFRAILTRLNAQTQVCLAAAFLACLTTTWGEGSAPKESSTAKIGKPVVVIDNFSFSPTVITVPIGATVTWTNHDDVPHVIASAENQFTKSPALDTDESFSHTFTAAGTYTYFCSIHPHMTGKVIVQ